MPNSNISPSQKKERDQRCCRKVQPEASPEEPKKTVKRTMPERPLEKDGIYRIAEKKRLFQRTRSHMQACPSIPSHGRPSSTVLIVTKRECRITLKAEMKHGYSAVKARSSRMQKSNRTKSVANQSQDREPNKQSKANPYASAKPSRQKDDEGSPRS
jgi:hypothetical protein